MASNTSQTDEQEVKPCYHCDAKTRTNAFCELWLVWTCAACRRTAHRAHHATCERVVPQRKLTAAEGPKYFTIWLTRYDGVRMPITVRLGDKITMEDHWLGTYIFAAAALILVLEDRAEINARILQGLAEAR